MSNLFFGNRRLSVCRWMTLGLLVFFNGMSAGTAAPGVVKSVFHDWQIRCDTVPGAKKEQCGLVQWVVSEERPGLTLTVMVLKTADQKRQLLRIVAEPIAQLWVAPGVGLKIDGTDFGNAGFARCLPNGCIAEVGLGDGDPNHLLERLRKGKIATFFIYLTPNLGVGFPLKLDGFAEGYDKLQ